MTPDETEKRIAEITKRIYAYITPYRYENCTIAVDDARLLLAEIANLREELADYRKELLRLRDTVCEADVESIDAIVRPEHRGD